MAGINRNIGILYPYPNDIRHFYIEWWLAGGSFTTKDLLRYIKNRNKVIGDIHYP